MHRPLRNRTRLALAALAALALAACGQAAPTETPAQGSQAAGASALPPGFVPADDEARAEMRQAVADNVANQLARAVEGQRHLHGHGDEHGHGGGHDDHAEGHGHEHEGAPKVPELLGQWTLDREAFKATEEFLELTEPQQQQTIAAMAKLTMDMHFKAEAVTLSMAMEGREQSEDVGYRVVSRDGVALVLEMDGRVPGRPTETMDATLRGDQLMLSMMGQRVFMKRVTGQK